MAIVPYEITPEDGLRMLGHAPDSVEGPVQQRAGDDPPPADDPRPFLGTHNMARDLVTVGCFDCEQALTPQNAQKPCPGDPTEPTGPGLLPASAGLGGVGRNDPCPCGSGKKFKRCHGAVA